MSMNWKKDFIMSGSSCRKDLTGVRKRFSFAPWRIDADRLKEPLCFAAALALLMCATALAADGLGLAFFWRDASPEAEALVEKHIPQSGGQLDDATFTVREAVFDGNTLQAVVAVQGAHGKRAVMQGYNGNVSADSVLVDCGEEGSIEWADEEDGTLLLYISQAISSEEAQLSVTWPCSTALASADGSRWVSQQSGVLHFEVPRIEAQTLRLSATVDWSGLLTVTDVEVAYTPLGMDLQIRYVPGERLKNAVPFFYVEREEDAVNHRGGEISRTAMRRMAIPCMPGFTRQTACRIR